MKLTKKTEKRIAEVITLFLAILMMTTFIIAVVGIPYYVNKLFASQIEEQKEISIIIDGEKYDF